MESLDIFSDRFVKEFESTTKKPFSFYLDFVESNGYDCVNYGNVWDIGTSLIIKLPIDIQYRLIEDYFKEPSYNINLDFVKVVYYWFKYFDKIKGIENNQLLTLSFTINFHLNKVVGRFTRSKFLSLIFLKYDSKDICLRDYYDSQQIDNLLIGAMFSDIDVWEFKKIIDKIVKNKICFEESFDVLNWIFLKYESYGIDTKKVFGTLVDLVKIEFL